MAGLKSRKVYDGGTKALRFDLEELEDTIVFESLVSQGRYVYGHALVFSLTFEEAT